MHGAPHDAAGVNLQGGRVDRVGESSLHRHALAAARDRRERGALGSQCCRAGHAFKAQGAIGQRVQRRGCRVRVGRGLRGLPSAARATKRKLGRPAPGCPRARTATGVAAGTASGTQASAGMQAGARSGGAHPSHAVPSCSASCSRAELEPRPRVRPRCGSCAGVRGRSTQGSPTLGGRAGWRTGKPPHTGMHADARAHASRVHAGRQRGPAAQGCSQPPVPHALLCRSHAVPGPASPPPQPPPPPVPWPGQNCRLAGRAGSPLRSAAAAAFPSRK